MDSPSSNRYIVDLGVRSRRPSPDETPQRISVQLDSNSPGPETNVSSHKRRRRKRVCRMSVRSVVGQVVRLDSAGHNDTSLRLGRPKLGSKAPATSTSRKRQAPATLLARFESARLNSAPCSNDTSSLASGTRPLAEGEASIDDRNKKQGSRSMDVEQWHARG